MSFDVKAAIKKPWVKWTLIAVGAIGAFFILRNMSGGGSAGSSSSSTGVSDAQAHDAAQLQAQENAISASQASQSATQQYQLQAQAAQIKGTIDLATVNNAEQTQLANISLQGIKAQLDAATTQQKNSLDSTVALANITANTQMHISDNQTGSVNKQTAAQSKANTIGAVAGIAGMAIAAFF